MIKTGQDRVTSKKKRETRDIFLFIYPFQLEKKFKKKF